VIREIVTDVLLCLSALTVAGSALGLLVMKDAAARLHFVAPVTFVALFFMAVAGPYLSHATIRAIRVREHGDWRPHPPPRGEGEKR
jgi:multisubunit Na+/H+ antiporter MnhG subunit